MSSLEHRAGSRFSVLPRLLMRLSGGFVMALHEMPGERLVEFVEGMWPARVTHLTELVKRKKQGKSNSGLFAITVDDGVGDNVRGLAQLFRARAWPATFYLPTQYLDTGEPMPFQLWWRLKPLLKRRKLNLKSGTLDLSPPGAIEALSRKIEGMWYRERLESYLPLTLELAEAVAQAPTQLHCPAPITWSEVEVLSKDNLIRFESHGISHAAMSALTDEEIMFEMRHSRDILEERTGRPCRHLCYPFGSPESIGTAAPRLAQRFYDSAATMSMGSIDTADPWLLPRIPLYPKNSLAFARMKVLLKCTTLHRAA